MTDSDVLGASHLQHSLLGHRDAAKGKGGFCLCTLVVGSDVKLVIESQSWSTVVFKKSTMALWTNSHYVASSQKSPFGTKNQTHALALAWQALVLLS